MVTTFQVCVIVLVNHWAKAAAYLLYAPRPMVAAATPKAVAALDTKISQINTSLSADGAGKAPIKHDSNTDIYGLGTSTNYGHVKLGSANQNGATAADGVAAPNGHTHSQYLTAHQDISGKAPNNHASTATTYGVGTSTNYGHVKLSDATDDSASDTSAATAATPKAVDALRKALLLLFRNENIKYFGTSASTDGGTATVSWQTSALFPTTPESVPLQLNDMILIRWTNTYNSLHAKSMMKIGSYYYELNSISEKDKYSLLKVTKLSTSTSYTSNGNNTDGYLTDILKNFEL